MHARSGLAALAAAVTAIAASGCSSAGTATLDPVAQAAEVTTHSGGAHIALSIQMNLGSLGGSLDIVGNGDLNFETGEGEVFCTLSGFGALAQSPIGANGTEMTEVYKDQNIYVSSPLFAGKLPNGASWVGVNLGRIAAQYDLEPQALSSGESNPAEYLEYLKAYGGSLQPAGHAVVRGVPTSVYSGAIDLRRAAQTLPSHDRAATEASYGRLIAQIGTSSLPVRVWLDSHELIRRLTMTIPVTVAQSKLQISIQEELFDFGATPAVSAPAASQVYEATPGQPAGTSLG